MTSPGSSASWSAVATNGPKSRTMPARVRSAAGMSRRKRRAQKFFSEIVPARWCSARSRVVIRYPDRVKNVDTPR